MSHSARKLEFQAAPGTWQLILAHPEPDLASVVDSFWEVRGQTTRFQEKVLPGGFVELMFNLGGPQRILTNREAVACSDSWLSGLHSHAIHIESMGGSHLVAARMTAPGAARVFGSLAGAGNAVIQLEAIIGRQASLLREELQSAGSATERFDILERFIRTRLHASAPTPSAVAAAMHNIHSARGTIRITTLCRDLGVSRKHLNALFNHHVGVSPKTVARIDRFVFAVKLIEGREVVDWSRLALLTGFADQSHLVREFRDIATASPIEFLRQRAPDNSSLLLDG